VLSYVLNWEGHRWTSSYSTLRRPLPKQLTEATKNPTHDNWCYYRLNQLYPTFELYTVPADIYDTVLYWSLVALWCTLRHNCEVASQIVLISPPPSADISLYDKTVFTHLPLSLLSCFARKSPIYDVFVYRNIFMTYLDSVHIVARRSCKSVDAASVTLISKHSPATVSSKINIASSSTQLSAMSCIEIQ